MVPELELEINQLVKKASQNLQTDLAYAAPEIYDLHIVRHMGSLAEDVKTLIEGD